MESHGGKKKTKAKTYGPDKSAGKSGPQKGQVPGPREIDALAALVAKGRLTEAAGLAQEMTVRFPLHGFGWKALGVVFKQMGRSSDALAPLQKAATLLPKDAEAHYNLGIVLQEIGRLVDAQASYRMALQIKPDLAWAHYNLGNCLQNLGRLDEAMASYERVLEIKSDVAEAHANLGASFRALGRLDEAEASYRRALVIRPDLAEAHSNLGNILQDQGQLYEAEASCRRALRIKSDFVEAHSNLGNTLHDLGRLDEAEASYRRSLQIREDYAEAHNNLGITLQDMGRLGEAETSYRRALEKTPGYAEAHSNLGNILQDLGRLDEAEASYRRALQIKRDFAKAQYNLGATLNALDRLAEAEASYQRALQIKPDFTDALNNLALLLHAQGKSIFALDIIKRSLKVGETDEAKRLFVACVKHLRWTRDDSEIEAAMVRAVSEPWDQPRELARSSTALVMLKPDINGCVARAVDAWPLRLSAQHLFGSNGLAAFATNRLLCALLCSTQNCDIEMERFLTMARRTMLDGATTVTASSAEDETVLSFFSALARQCFVNEYVFSHTEDEIQKAGELRDSLVAALEAKTPVPVHWPLAVAAYFPLYSLPLAARLLDTQWPGEVIAVLIQQIREPEEEVKLRATIPRLTEIEDEVSILVQNQYEENPYPRWVNAAPPGKAKNVLRYLCQKFPLASFKRHFRSGSIDVLIAGCGTGQHSIGTAQLFQGAQVLAVDLSMTSLSYAKRKTRELGLTTIEHAQADLLKLGSLGRSFDVIESVGVLHHLADPWAGWRVLLSLLRPCGFMKLGLYSEVARRDIVRARALMAERRYGSSADEIRRCRQDLLDLDKNVSLGNVLMSKDFFTISSCRDLLFHVQEHRMSLDGIDAFIRRNNLTFIGFEINDDVLHMYRQRFPADLAATDLACWHVFEKENPDTFASMYQFWIQKADGIS